MCELTLDLIRIDVHGTELVAHERMPPFPCYIPAVENRPGGGKLNQDADHKKERGKKHKQENRPYDVHNPLDTPLSGVVPIPRKSYSFTAFAGFNAEWKEVRVHNSSSSRSSGIEAC